MKQENRSNTVEAAEYRYSGQAGVSPSLKIAKVWFNRVILPRRIKDARTGKYRLADMGEAGGELYPVWGTKLSELSDFGIGIGIYFSTLLHLCILMFILAAVSIPTISYYWSPEYSLDNIGKSIDFRIWGSAVCRNEKNVTFTDGSDSVQELCQLDSLQLHVDIISVVVLWLYIFVIGVIQDKVIVSFDEAEQTAQDYSVQVLDPNEDARDPDEWFEFFKQFGPVKFVTVALDNRELLQALSKKRYIKHMIQLESDDLVRDHNNANLLPNSTSKKSCLTSFFQNFGINCDLSYWQSRLHEQCDKLASLRSKAYPVASVFVTFDTEEAQRHCLKSLRTGILASRDDMVNTSAIPLERRFRGHNVLNVVEPPEPSNVLWLNVGVKWATRATQQFTTACIVAMFIAFTVFITGTLNDSNGFGDWGVYVVAYTISIIDFVVSTLMRYVNMIEQHKEAGREQLSLLNKLLVFRCFNSAFVIYWLTEFDEVLDQRALLQIQAILIANMVTTPALQLLSFYYRFMQYYAAPKAKTQTKMNSYYNGVFWNLAERYTDITKTVWVALFYKPLLPTGLFITTCGLIINYWVDKYSLLRRWKVPPKFGPAMAHASRWHIVLVGMAALIMTGRWYRGWPYDNVCTDGNGSFYECDKNPTPWSVFDPTDLKPWMDSTQKSIVETLSILIIILSAIGVGFLIVSISIKFLRKLFHGKYRPVGEATETRFSDVKEIRAYIPQFQVPFLNLPLIAVDTSKFNHQYFSWIGNYDRYNVIHEEEVCSSSLSEGQDHSMMFSTCKEYMINSDGTSTDRTSEKFLANHI